MASEALGGAAHTGSASVALAKDLQAALCALGLEPLRSRERIPPELLGKAAAQRKPANRKRDRGVEKRSPTPEALNHTLQQLITGPGAWTRCKLLKQKQPVPRPRTAASVSGAWQEWPCRCKTGGFRFYCILDFEATCQQDNTQWNHEIIEIPVVLLCARTLRVVSEFHRYVRPTEHPKLSDFCTSLTGIQQQHVDQAEPLSDVLKALGGWLVQQGLLPSPVKPDGKTDDTTPSSGAGDVAAPASDRFCGERHTGASTSSAAHPAYLACGAHTFAFLTDGPWDFYSFLRTECQRKHISLPPYLSAWVDVRHHYSRSYNCRRFGVTAMLAGLGVEFKGRAHSGIDDARNITRIAAQLLADGFVLTVNGTLTEPGSYKFANKSAPGSNANSEHKTEKGTAASTDAVHSDSHSVTHERGSAGKGKGKDKGKDKGKGSGGQMT